MSLVASLYTVFSSFMYFPAVFKILLFPYVQMGFHVLLTTFSLSIDLLMDMKAGFISL